MYLNEATLLNNVRVRYNKDHIYVCFFSPSILVCISTGINPLYMCSCNGLKSILLMKLDSSDLRRYSNRLRTEGERSLSLFPLGKGTRW